MCGALGAGVWSLRAASRASAEADRPTWHATTN
jgi:hypothetical protein